MKTTFLAKEIVQSRKKEGCGKTNDLRRDEKSCCAALFLFHAGRALRARPCWRLVPRGPLSHRRTTPTSAPFPRCAGRVSDGAAGREEVKRRPGLRFDSRPAAGKANEFVFRARTPERKEGGVPCSVLVRACLPAKPMNSVFEREPRNGKRRKGGPCSGSVRACLPAKPMNSVSEREPRTGKRWKSGRAQFRFAPACRQSQ